MQRPAHHGWLHILGLIGLSVIVTFWILAGVRGDTTYAAPPPYQQPAFLVQTDLCTQLLTNGDFEGTGGWVEYSSLNLPLISDFPPPSGAYRSGNRGAYLADYNQARDYIAQQVAIPADATQAVLTYWWQVETQETTLRAYDFLTVTVDAALEQPIAVIGSHSNQDAEAIWHQNTVDLSAYKGRTVYLRFEAVTDANRPTAFYLDDITLDVCRAAAATPTPTPSPSPTPTAAPNPAGETIMAITPASVEATISATAPVTVSVVMTNVVDLGGFEFTLTYDPRIVHVSGVRVGPFLGSTGRTVTPLPANIDNTNGRVDFGAFSFGSASGPSGTGVLAEIGLVPRGTGTSPLQFAAAQATNTAGNVLSITLQDGQITVRECSPYDMDCDGDIDVVDIMHVASRWNCRQGDTCYDPKYDLDRSGRIDVVDIMQVAARWGCTRGDACYWGATGQPRPTALEAVVSIPDITVPSTGRAIAVPIRVEGAVDMAAFEAEVRFNPRLLSVEGVVMGEFLGRTGREVILLPPQMDPNAGAIRFALFTYGTAPGVNGSGEVAYVLLRPLGHGQVTPRLSDVQVVNTRGQPDAVTLRAGTLNIVTGYPLHLPWLAQ